MSDNWGKGYDAGQSGMLQAIKTAEQLAAQRERERIIELIMEIEDGDEWIEMPSDKLIALIKGENK